MISSRRRADDEDDLSILYGTLPPSQQIESEELDELGRVVPKANPTVARRERQAARTLRRSRRNNGISNTDAEEGYSTDSSLSPSDAMDYHTAISKLKADGKNILADVRAVAFQNPSQGLGKWFGQWRSQYGDSYIGAWGGLGLVGAWEFWVRLENLGWNPFDVSLCCLVGLDAHNSHGQDSKRLDEFSWYKSLYEYSHPGSGEDAEAKLGPDGDLISAMTSTAIIPQLSKEIVDGRVFDPYSAAAVRRALDVTQQIEASVQTENAKFHVSCRVVFSLLSLIHVFADAAEVISIVFPRGGD
jgi:GC-rich sequence DNA-binding factor